MAFLPQFDYEVFLSYGWGENDDPKSGDRAWVHEFKKAFERDVSDSLPHKIRVYLEVEHSQAGTVPKNLEAALRSSAIFLFVITENSCRKEEPESWCQWEMRQFLEYSLNPITRDRNQVFAIRIRPVERERWPEGLNPYTFGTMEDGRWSQFDSADLLKRNSPCGKMFQNVVYDVARQLKEIQATIANTDYLADTSEDLSQKLIDTQKETRLAKRKAVRLEPSALKSEEEFTLGVRRLLRWSDRSIHLVDNDFDAARNGWSASVQEIQLRLARERFAGLQQNKMNIWRHPTSKVPSFDLLAEAFENANISQSTAFQDFLQFLLGRDSKPTISVPPSIPEAVTPFVYVDCIEGDEEAIQRLASHFEERRILVCWSFFEGPLPQRNKFNRQYTERCRSVVVLYGKRNRFRTFSACNNVTAALGARANSVSKVVLLHPTSDPDRRFFIHPDFKSLLWDDPSQPPHGFLEFIAPCGQEAQP